MTLSERLSAARGCQHLETAPRGDGYVTCWRCGAVLSEAVAR